MMIVRRRGCRRCPRNSPLVGIGGVMGYLKGGSQKSLIAGGFSASLLHFTSLKSPRLLVLGSLLLLLE
ncbi:hypothetical protein ACS0TY_036175 [Phlomoides rotata]